MIKIKVCGMKDPLNVKQVVKFKPDYLGFIFYPGSPRFVGYEPDYSLGRSVPSDIIKTGVFVDEDQDRILDMASGFGLGMVQLHGNESSDYCSRIRSSGLTVIKSFNIDEDFNFDDIRPFLRNCDYFLFDTKSEKPGGSGKKFRWEKLTAYNLDKPFILSGGIGPDDTGLIADIRNRGFVAVDINSRFELSPGIKDLKLVEKFIDQVKNSVT